MDFPLYNSRILSDGKRYNLVDPADRLKYFHAKLGNKIEKLKEYLDTGTFVGYMLAKKQAGKGTYSKMIEEILGPERFAHISVGDVVRAVHGQLENREFREELKTEVAKHYRGYISIDDSIEALLNRTQDKVSVPTEFLITLLKMEIDKIGRKALFIDGLPRSADQITYSLYFRELINYRYDPDFFVVIDVPEEIIDARMRNRVVCPVCHTSKNMLINPGKFIHYDRPDKQFYLLCDNKKCSGYETAKLERKEGDAAGIESIRGRLKTDSELIDMAMNLHGIPKVSVRSSMPVESAGDYLEDYEIQPAYRYKETAEGAVTTETYPWVFKDDSGVESYTWYAATFVLSIFEQIYNIVIGE